MLAGALLLAAAWGVPAPQPDRYVLVDDAAIERLDGCRRVLHAPFRRDVALTFDRPWEGKESGYATVCSDGAGGYRLYYRGGGGATGREVTCVAFSRDGIRWERPELGLFEFEGSPRNNIVWTAREKYGRESHNFAPFLDVSPACRPDERWKAVAQTIWDVAGKGSRKSLVALSSPDGLRWKRMQDRPVITDGAFDSLNTAFWDANLSRYVCYLRDGLRGFRWVRRATSSDFLHWSRPEWLEFPGSPDEHLYTNAIVPYPNAKGLYVGFPMRFVPERKSVGFPPQTTDGLSDALFMASRDGLAWTRYREAYLRPGVEAENWGHAHGNQTPVWGFLTTSEREWSFYWMDSYGTTPQVRRGVVRPDGFASIHADAREATLTTKPLTIRPTPAAAGVPYRLRLNLATSAVGWIKVAILDRRGRELAQFSQNRADPSYGDELDRIVTWRGDPTIALDANTVRLRFRLFDADLYAFRFEPL